MDGGGQIEMRPPETVMRLRRMGAFHATRLSFLRALLRRMAREGWRADRPVWELDEQGVGHAVYTVHGPERAYSLVAFSHDLPDHLRSDRVIAEAWDATFALVDGVPEAHDIARLAVQVPLQEAGRMTEKELSLSRANRSVRLFNAVVAALAAGRQPARRDLVDVGYLMRTTAVYGASKFGMADRAAIAGRPELAGPFQAEMLNVWLTRAFTVDLVDHLARCRGGAAAVRLAPELRRQIGVGNATGLGMAPFLINHTALIHRWMAAREAALARVRAAPVTDRAMAVVRERLGRVQRHLASWHIDNERGRAANAAVAGDLERLADRLDGVADGAWDALWTWAEAALGIDGQEMLVSLLLEPQGALIDDLAEEMAADEDAAFPLDADQSVAELAATIAAHYGWALAIDWHDAAATARLWYTSVEKLEPRLAERAEEPLEAYEQPLAPGRDIAALNAALAEWPGTSPLADFLARHPEHRHAVRRCQIVSHHPYGEIRDNTIAADMLPIDLLRAKLSFFGATRFDPKSDRWVRVTLFQGAPFPDEPADWGADDWMWSP